MRGDSRCDARQREPKETGTKGGAAARTCPADSLVHPRRPANVDLAGLTRRRQLVLEHFLRDVAHAAGPRGLPKVAGRLLVDNIVPAETQLRDTKVRARMLGRDGSKEDERSIFLMRRAKGRERNRGARMKAAARTR